MKTKRLLLVIVILLMLSACSDPKNRPVTGSGYEFVIGVSQSNLIDPLQVAVYEQLRENIQKYPEARLVFADAAGDSTRQIENIHHFVDLNIDLLIITPVHTDQLQQTLKEVGEKVPIIILGTKTESESCDMFIGPDHYNNGYLAAEFIHTLIGEKEGKVVEVTGTVDSLPAQQISNGFYDGLKQYPNITLVDSLDGDWLRDTAERRMKDFLILNPQVDVVFAHNDAMASGAHLAANDFRINQIKYIGIGGRENEGMIWVDNGLLSATLCCDTGSSEAIDWAIKILHGESYPAELILKAVLYTNETP